MTTTTPVRILRIRDLLAQTGLSRATIHRMRTSGLFPQPFYLSTRSIAWRADEIDEWIEERSQRRAG